MVRCDTSDPAYGLENVYEILAKEDLRYEQSILMDVKDKYVLHIYIAFVRPSIGISRNASSSVGNISPVT